MQFKKILLAISLMVFIPFKAVYASTEYSTPLLVLDTRNAFKLPRNFRVATTISPDMRIAGGAQFSELGLQKILQYLQTKRLVMIDLRQESHGFLNGNAISWYGPQDAANAGKTPTQINSDQMQLLLELLGKKTVQVSRVLNKSADGFIDRVKPLEFAVHQVSSESELASKYRLPYYRLYVQDFHAPTASEVDRFVEIMQKLPKTEWVYIHCHAGVGRTTTFMTMYDMMLHAKTASFEAILKRQKEIGGKDLQLLPKVSSFKYQSSEDRLAFLRAFYEYAHDNNDGFKTTWSKWISTRNNT